MLKSKAPIYPVSVDWNPPPIGDDEKAKNKARSARHRQNVEWFYQHANELIEKHHGKFACVDDGVAYIADSPREALALAMATDSHEDGTSFTQYLIHFRRPVARAI